jgi:peptidylprolyl isomerase
VQGRAFSNEELDAMENNMRQRFEANLFQAKSREKQAEIMRYQQEGNHERLNNLRDSILVEVHREMAETSSYRFTEEQRRDYTTIGGTPHLDGEYTVFGEVIEGLDVVERISRTQTGSMDRPVEDIRIISVKRVK